VLSPLDKILSRRERKLYSVASKPDKPILLVCGPPRSGTTLLTQYLINSLEVCYVNNLSSVFPRSSLTINRLLSRWIKPRAGDYNAFYGRSTGLAGNNDGLFLWDNWLGYERDVVPANLMANANENLPKYYGALLQQYGLPVVNKVNRLISAADLVAPILPTAKFIILWRNPVHLAQSLLLARELLTGSPEAPYGLNAGAESTGDAIEDVCRQVEFLHELIESQLTRLNKESVLVINYDEFLNLLLVTE